MATPTIVFVPGAWHTPEIFSSTVTNLSKHGYSTIGLDLPSVGAMPPHDSFNGDVRAVQDCLTQLVVTEEKDVVVVAHSYSGMPVVEAPVGLGKKDRQGRGLRGGVTRLVFIMAFAMPEGFQPTAGGAQYPYWMKVDKEKGIVRVTPEDAKEVLYNDLPSEEGDKWAAKIKHQSVGVYTSTTTFAAWRHIPSTFVIGTEDKTTFTPEVVEYMIKTAQAQQPDAFDVVEKCEGGGHCLMISHPDWLADVLRRAAGEKL